MPEKKLNWIKTAKHEKCPVCSAYTNKGLAYKNASYVTGETKKYAEVNLHIKHICKYCGHFFTNWLSKNLEDTSKKYSGIYETIPNTKTGNVRESKEKRLLYFALEIIGNPEKASILDFGCGPNIKPTMELREEGHDAHCCDILPFDSYDGEIFFKHSTELEKWHDYFDAIISVDVIEHLGNTLESWEYFNKILKKNGRMVHCFPSQMHYDFFHPFFATPFHTTLFSQKSLDIIIEKTGFELESIQQLFPVFPPAFIFKKVRNLGEKKKRTVKTLSHKLGKK